MVPPNGETVAEQCDGCQGAWELLIWGLLLGIALIGLVLVSMVEGGYSAEEGHAQACLVDRR